MAEGQQSPLASQRAKADKHNQPNKAWFPLGAREGFSQWWASISPAAAEHKVLSFVPYLQHAPTHTQTGKQTQSQSDSAGAAKESDDLSKTTSETAEPSSSDPYGPRRWHSSLIKLAGKDRALNEFSVERVGENVDNNLVILHGYGAGLGFFYKNFEPLSRQAGWRLYALDMLGMGRSSRPTFRIHAKDRQGKITETENFFVDALEEWRQQKGIDRFTLMGHSLGGYMAVCYALKYPGRLNKLILASPVGIPEDPYAVAAAMPEPETSTMQAEFSQDQSESKSGHSANGNGAPAKPNPRPIPKWLTYLWDANVSPFSVVRWAGPLGPRLVSGWTTRRFGQMPPEEASALHDYAYSLFRQRGSGEYALSYILAPGAYARSPLIRRIGDVGRGVIPPSVASASALAPAAASPAPAEPTRERGLPVTLLYGEHDWMDVVGGHAAVEKLRLRREEATRGLPPKEAALDAGEAKVLIVQNAGHHVYLDGWREFNGMLREEMRDVETRERERRSRAEFR